MKLMVWIPPPSGCNAYTATTFTVDYGTIANISGEDSCYVTVNSLLSWDNPCDTGFDLGLVIEVYYDIPGETLVWTTAAVTVPVTAGVDSLLLDPIGPIDTYSVAGGSGPLMRMHFRFTFPDSSTATLITYDDYTASCV